MTAKTGAQRQEALRQRNREAGLKEIRNLWAHPDDHEKIKEHAKKLWTDREKKFCLQG